MVALSRSATSSAPTPGLVGAAAHARAVAALRASFAAVHEGMPVWLAKRTTNLFRPRVQVAAPGLDVSGLRGVLAVDPEARSATVQGMATYETVVDATLAHGLMPLVVPQLKTITVGGAVTGLGIEASSFRHGLPHESVRSMDILTGTGEIVTASPDGADAQLYRAFPNSYGSLGYAVSLTIDLQPVAPWVRMRHIGFHDMSAVVAAIERIVAEGEWEGRAVDFVDGVVFGASTAYLTVGEWAHELEPGEAASDYTGGEVFYRSIPARATDVLTVRDYLWRWDTDWFWCSRAFGVQHPVVRRLWPDRLKRSDVYMRLIGLENRWHPAARIDRLRGRAARERVVQDVEIPLQRTADFLDWFLREVPIEPIWLCPIRLREPALVATAPGEATWPLYPMRPGEVYVNVGFWSTVAIEPGRVDGDVNRAIEAMVEQVGGHKSLYSDAYYSRDEFAARYGGSAYSAAKARYDPQGRFADLYDKAIGRR